MPDCKTTGGFANRHWLTALAVVLASGLHQQPALAESVAIVAFGGSNTFGKGVSRSDAYPAQLEKMLKAAGLDVSVKNEGTNGQNTAEELAKMDSAIPEGTRIVIFQPGGNDKGNNRRASIAGETEINIKAIVRKLTDRKILVLFSGGKGKQRMVAEFQVRTIDEINSLAPDDLQGDQQHLTPDGYRIAAEKMLPIVKAMIAELPTKR